MALFISIARRLLMMQLKVEEDWKSLSTRRKRVENLGRVHDVEYTYMKKINGMKLINMNNACVPTEIFLASMLLFIFIVVDLIFILVCCGFDREF